MQLRRTLVALGAAVLIADCENGARPPASGSSAPPGIPNGVYRTGHNVDDLVAAGLARKVAAEYAGTLTVELADGRYSDQQQPSQYAPCGGSYSSTATTIEVRFETKCSGAFTATWAIRGDVLTLVPTSVMPERDRAVVTAVFGSKPFRKIG